jgi:hypothetical protein
VFFAVAIHSSAKVKSVVLPIDQDGEVVGLELVLAGDEGTVYEPLSGHLNDVTVPQHNAMHNDSPLGCFLKSQDNVKKAMY